jgi:hypothetical protein
MMQLNEFEKEERLQEHLMEERIDQCDVRDSKQCITLTQNAAKLAKKRFMRFRFGCFRGKERCIVYVNMGRNNQHAREDFRRRLQEEGVAELGVATWSPEDRYTWAVFVDAPNADDWVGEARAAWVNAG